MSRVDEWIEAKAETITIDNPVKTSGFTSYEVTHVNANNSVSRRYKDFLQLRAALVAHFPGAFIPPLPQKKVGKGRFADGFIATRMRGLQHFMEEVLKSPDFESLNYVIAFWEHSDVREWVSLATLANEDAPRVGFMKRSLNSLKVSKAVLQQYNTVIDNDTVVEEMQESIEELWKKNKKTENAALNILKALGKIEATTSLRAQATLQCHAVDLDSTVIDDCEKDDEGRLKDRSLQLFSEAESILSARLRQHTASMQAHFVEPVQRYTSGLESFNKSFQSQRILKEDYVATDMAFHKEKASEEEMQTAQSAYEQGVQRVFRDYDRYKATRSADICNNLLGLCHLQVENCRMVSLAWEQLEQSLLQQHVTTSHKHYSSDRYNVTSYNSDRNNLHSGLNQAMLAELTQDDEDEADCISV